MADVVMPQLGETVTEGTITQWFKAVGDDVAEDDVLFEVSTDKVDTEVPATAAGTLTEILVAEGDTVDVGTVLARLGDGDGGSDAEPEAAAEPESTAGSEPESAAAAEPAEPAAESEPTGEGSGDVVNSPEPSANLETQAQADEGSGSAAPSALLSPVVRRLVNDNGLDPSQIEGTGVGGRITRRDVESVIESGAQSGASKASAARAGAPESGSSSGTRASTGSAPRVAPTVKSGDRDTVVPLNNIRKRTGEHMSMSKQVSPHVLTAVEVDFENVERVRQANKAQFKADEGFGLTYLPFISRALIDAISEYPRINASVGEGELVVHDYVNLAIAVDIDFDGLVAPVIHDADGKRMVALAREVSDLASRARSKKLSPDEISGGTVTITNPGQYGTLFQFPIINQPQVAILSTDGISRKPVVLTDEHGGESIAVHSVGVLSLAWDHRAFDGAYVAAFLDHLRTIIETRDWEAEL